jgi:beta-mannosidase
MKQLTKLSDQWWIKDYQNPVNVSSQAVDAIYNEPAGRETGWMEAILPGVVQEVLFEHGRLDKKVLETGLAEDCSWVSELDWAYRRKFQKPTQPGRVYLECLGLDTVADIYINRRLAARHRTVFMPCRADITEFIEEENELLIYFHCPQKIIESLREKLPESYGSRLTPASLLRKPQGDFNTHGGVMPYFTPIGTFDDIRLTVVDRCEIEHMDVDVRFTEDFSQAMLSVKLDCPSYAGVIPALALADPDGSMVFSLEGEAAAIQQTESGVEYRFNAAVDSPKLWWPRNYGGQPLYTLTASLSLGHDTLDTCVKRIGLRQVEVVGDMKFRVNGQVVKLWGSCISPMWGVSHRWVRERGLKLLDLAVQANMNALRMWGPGQYYHDEWYEQADRLGVFIWQEFHTWGTHMPDLPEHFAAVLREAEWSIKRLKHHPCIFMWCGGNEQIYMGELYDTERKIHLGMDLIRYDLKNLVAKLDPYRYYHISSPSDGLYANEAAFGDTHGSRASLSFLPGEGHSHFFSEDIRTFVPELKSLKRFIPAEALWPEGYVDTTPYGVCKPMPPAWMDRTINHMEEKTGPHELFYDATDPRSLVYKMNAAASYDIRLIVQRLRQGRPYYDSMSARQCNGYLLWKLNTAWPQIYCSIIDYYMEPGQVYYAIRRAYAPIHVTVDLQDHVYLWGINDTPTDFAGQLTVEIFDLESEQMAKARTFPVGIPSGDSMILKNMDDMGQFRRTCVIHVTLADKDGHLVSEDFQYIKPERKLPFPDVRLTLTAEGERLIRITAGRFARCVELNGDNHGDEFGWNFEDNYFDLMPGQSRLIKILGWHDHGTVSARAFYSPYTASVEL